MRYRALILVLALLAGACATYTDELQPVRGAAVDGRPEAAIEFLNERLGTATASEAPAKLDEDAILWLLERGALLQGIGEYRDSARDLSLADQNLEVLDVAREKSTDLARYLYSDSAVAYQAPPYERLLLNAVNMVNFLALGNYEGARVEARRFQVFREFVESSDDREALPGVLGLGSYLSGLAFELSGDYRTATRHYASAYAYGLKGSELTGRLTALLRVTGVRPSEDDPDLAALVEAAQRAGPLDPEAYAREWVDGQAVAVVQTGWIPYKSPERVSLATALLWVGLVTSGPRLDEDEVRNLQKLLAEGVVKWINFPVLVTAGLPGPASPRLLVDGESGGGSVGARPAADAVAEYERQKGTMMVAALTRLLTRIAAGKLTEAAIEKGTEKKGKKRKSGEVVGWLAGLAVEATLSALDRPDTRCWTMLPGEIRIFRQSVAPGEHVVSAVVRGRREDRTVSMSEHGSAVVNFSALR